MGPPVAMRFAGCPAAVANLWDVTDRDIDRFSQAVLTGWISGGSSGCEADLSSSSGNSSSSSSSSDMSAAVAGSRAACKLPHLVGAAPVCYGIPSTVFLSSRPGT